MAKYHVMIYELYILQYSSTHLSNWDLEKLERNSWYTLQYFAIRYFMNWNVTHESIIFWTVFTFNRNSLPNPATNSKPYPLVTVSLTWASYQIRKIAGCACAGNAGNVFPRRRFQRKLLVSDPGMHHGTCVTHVPWCMSGSLTCGDGENVPGIPGACAPAILRIWQEAHRHVLSTVWCRQYLIFIFMSYFVVTLVTGFALVEVLIDVFVLLQRLAVLFCIKYFSFA